MTVNADYVEKTYLCNGTTTTFSIPWKFFEDEIAVFKDKTFEIYPNTDYKIINNNDEGGEIIFNEAPGAGRYITIVRSIALYQYIKFLEGEDFPAHDYEYSLDRVYMALQMLKANVARCLQAPAGEDDFVSFVHKFLKMDYAGQGQTDWQSNYSYSMVELTRYDGYWWMSLTDNNKGNTPSSSSSFWTKFAICESYSKDELDERLAQKANTADVYTKAEVDEKIPTVLTFTNKSISVSSWSASTAITGYGFEAAIELNGVTDEMIPQVTFSVTDAVSGNLAPVAETYDGGIKIFAKAAADVTIKSITCVEG